MVRYFIGLRQLVLILQTIRIWVADGANAPLQGSDANQKPDLVLLPADVARASKRLDWRDVSAIGEMKINKTPNTVKSSYIEAAGKTALLLYAQDG